MKSDILKSFFKLNFPDIGQIKKLVFGKRHIGVLLNNNQLGTCATLGNVLLAKKEDLLQPDFDNLSHRALLIAYYNACYNYNYKLIGKSDITDILDFSHYKKVVMIGYFRTLVVKLDALNIPLYVFDLEDIEERLTDMKLQGTYLTQAEAVIVTATTLLNNTLDRIVEQTNKNCDIFLLGPTSIMNSHFFKLRNLKYIFGSVFTESEKVLEIIAKGGGIKDISGNMQKKHLKSL